MRIKAAPAVSLLTVALLLLTWIGVVLAATTPTPEQRKLFVEGAKLWPVYCAQCHNARPGSQFSPSQWDTITMHMRTQSIMPAKDMRAIKEFLKEAR
jgi:mono/diheme cytochrome c family protein